MTDHPISFYRPYKCNKCGQGFYRNNILKDHVSRCEAKEVSIDNEQLVEISQGPASLQTSNSDSKKSEIKLIGKTEILAKKTACSSRHVNHSEDNRPEGGAPSEYLSCDEPKSSGTNYQLNMAQVSLGHPCAPTYKKQNSNLYFHS